MNGSLHDYTTVTEAPGAKASAEQLERLYTRYAFAARYCEGKEVLEVACGSGQGLGLLAKVSKRVVGGDIDEHNLVHARRQYAGRRGIELKVLDAQDLPFEDNAFDVIICFEAIYYLAQPVLFFKEAKRVLKSGGLLVLCSVNIEWEDFNPSPYSYKYYPVSGIARLLREAGFEDKSEFFASSPVPGDDAPDAVISAIKRAAVRLKVMPKTMKGKEFLKRVFFGRLSAMPAEIGDEAFKAPAPVRVMPVSPQNGYKIIYAIARK